MAETETRENWSNQRIAFEFAQMSEHVDKLLYDEETDSYWKFDGHIWVPYSQKSMMREVSELIWSRNPKNRLTDGKKKDIVSQVSDYLGKAVNSNTCGARKLGHYVFGIEEKGISFTDKILLFDGMTTVEHSADLDRVCFVDLKFAYEELASATSPIFDKYLIETCTRPDGTFNDKMAAQLQEVAGYILGNEKTDKMFILYGTGANGKSPYLDILESMIGASRVSSLSMDEMVSDRFAIADLVGMKANILDEDESERIKFGKIKAIISGRPQRAQRKFKDGFRFRPQIKWIVANNLGVEVDVSLHANKRRLMIIPFEHVIEDERMYDRSLSKKIIRQELPAIVRWALEGYKRLIKNNCVFTASIESDAMMTKTEESNNSVVEYLRQTWKRDDALIGIPTSEMLAEYFTWCRDNGRKNPMTSNKFGRQATPILGESQLAKINGKIVRCYRVRRIDGNDKLANIAPKEDPAKEQSLPNF